MKESIKKSRTHNNRSLFEEVLTDSSNSKLINKPSSSPFAVFRNYKNPQMFKISFIRSYKLTNAIRNYLAESGVDFELVMLTKSEVMRLVAAYFSKVNNNKLTERQISLFGELRERSTQEMKKEARDRRKKAHYKRFNKAKSLRAFLRDQRVLFVISSNNKSEFLKIKRIHQAYLEGKSYTKAQKRFLEKLRQKTRDLSFNFNNSQSKKKTSLILTKNLQDVLALRVTLRIKKS